MREFGDVGLVGEDDGVWVVTSGVGADVGWEIEVGRVSGEVGERDGVVGSDGVVKELVTNANRGSA